MSSTQLILPVIHLNGTGPTALINDYSAAIAALDRALHLITYAYHERDYYPLGEDVVRIARLQHLDRCGALRRTINELTAIEQHAHEVREARDNAHLARNS